MAEPQPRRSLINGLPTVVLMLAALAAAGYGIYLLVTNQARTIGIFLIGIGLVFLPIRILSVLGSLVCIGAGVYFFALYGVGLQGVVFVVVGLVGLADHARAVSDERQAAARRSD